MIDISIVIVSWNVRDFLKKCLASIYKNRDELNLEVFVVDNASADGTVEMIEKDFPEVKITANKNNLGFATANNQAIKKTSGRYILLLNPDTEICGNTLKMMVGFMEKNQKIGIAGCKHCYPDWTLQPSVRRLPSLLPVLLILTKIAKIIPGLPALNRYLAKDFDYKITQPAEQVAGSFFMTRKEAIESIGLMDEKFFLWFEEVDYCKRALTKGWQIWYNAENKIIHHGGQSFGQRLTLKKQLLFCKSARYYFKKHGYK